MGKELKVAKQQLGDAKKGYEATLTKLGVSESAAAAATSNTPGAVVAPVPAVASAATTKLTDDLKKQLAGIAGLTVEARGDRVVVGLEQGTLFDGNETEVGLAGYKVLYKFGKILKTGEGSPHGRHRSGRRQARQVLEHRRRPCGVAGPLRDRRPQRGSAPGGLQRPRRPPGPRRPAHRVRARVRARDDQVLKLLITA